VIGPKRLSLLILPLLIPVSQSGCVGLRGLAYLTQPRQIQKPEFELSGRVAIVIDAARPGQANPVFESTLYKRIVELLRENEVTATIIPYDDITNLRQTQADFTSWSVQKIGRELNADQVLYVRVENLSLAQKDEPVMTPAVTLRVKLIAPRAPAANARLWPETDKEREGREVACKRHPVENEGVDRVDSEAAKLARETAYYVARIFHKWDAEVPPPRER
jgi:hypothetical protein